MKIIGFCDLNGFEINDQLDLATKLNIDQVILKQYNDKKIYELEKSDINDLKISLKDHKKSIIMLDPQIDTFDLYDLDLLDENYKKYIKTLEIANQLKIDNIIIRLGKIKDIIMELKNVEEQIVPLIEAAKKYNKRLLILQGKEKANSLVYILKKYHSKNFGLIFDPKRAVLNDEAPLTVYRLLKNYFDFFVASDVDSKNNPELLGYGKTKIIDLMKRLNRDGYKGDIIFDDSFGPFLGSNETKKVSLFKKLFSKNKNINNYLIGYSQRIFPGEEEKIATAEEIFLNQIKALKIIFNLR